jgi:2-keto-3-deoxy-galactonokinase
MGGECEDLSSFLNGFGFEEEELDAVLHELNSFRTIPGTTIERYMNHVINTIEEDDRHAFLKGILVGVAIRKTEDALEHPDLTEEEMRINREIEKLGFSE